MFESAERLIPVFEKAYQGSQDLESGLLAIREMGATQVDSVMVLRVVLKISLAEADDLVLNSMTWQDRFEGTLRLREQIWEASELVYEVGESIDWSEIARGTIVLKLDARTQQEIEASGGIIEQGCWMVSISPAEFGALWRMGFFEKLSKATNLHFSDYEEILLRHQHISVVRGVLRTFRREFGANVFSQILGPLDQMLTISERTLEPLIFIL